MPGEGIGPEDEFKTKAAASNVFVVIKLTGTLCTLPKENEVTVTGENAGIYCQVLLYAVGKEFREVNCGSTGDENLRFAGKKASFFGNESIKLANGWGWYIE